MMLYDHLKKKKKPFPSYASKLPLPIVFLIHITAIIHIYIYAYTMRRGYLLGVLCVGLFVVASCTSFSHATSPPHSSAMQPSTAPANAAVGGSSNRESVSSPDPVESGVMTPGSNVAKLHDCFQSSSASRRNFDEIHYIVPGDPFLTMGFGHFATSSLNSFFHAMRSQDTPAFQQLVNDMLSVMNKPENAAMWTQFQQQSGVSGKSRTDFEQGFSKLLCASADSVSRCYRRTSKPWADSVKTGFNSPTNWLHAGWKYASMSRLVASFQVKHWVAKFVEEPERICRQNAFATLGGIASVASSKSSGGMIPRGGRYGRKLSLNVPAGCGQPAMKFDMPMDHVPAQYRGTEPESPKLLADYRSLAVWKYYQAKKLAKERKRNKCSRAARYMTENRGRMNKIWEAWYAGAWGPLRLVGSPTHVLIHTGQYMQQGSFADATTTVSSASHAGAVAAPVVHSTAAQHHAPSAPSARAPSQQARSAETGEAAAAASATTSSGVEIGTGMGMGTGTGTGTATGTAPAHSGRTELQEVGYKAGQAIRRRLGEAFRDAFN
jgi:hypothetical protein